MDIKKQPFVKMFITLSFRLCEFDLIKNTKSGKINHPKFGIKQLTKNVYESL